MKTALNEFEQDDLNAYVQGSLVVHLDAVEKTGRLVDEVSGLETDEIKALESEIADLQAALDAAKKELKATRRELTEENTDYAGLQDQLDAEKYIVKASLEMVLRGTTEQRLRAHRNGDDYKASNVGVGVWRGKRVSAATLAWGGWRVDSFDDANLFWEWLKERGDHDMVTFSVSVGHNAQKGYKQADLNAYLLTALRVNELPGVQAKPLVLKKCKKTDDSAFVLEDAESTESR